jgi:zinc transporter ZupT
MQITAPAEGVPALVSALAGALAAAALGPALVRAWPFDRRLLLGALGALAAGLMLGAAYLIMATGMRSRPGITPLAAVLTVPLIFLAHRRIHATQPLEGAARRMALLHGIPEGLALGAAMALRVSLGLWLGVTIVLHNVAEGALFGARNEGSTVSAADTWRRMGLALGDKVPQAVAAALAYALAHDVPAARAPLLASAFAGLVYLVIAELLLEAYGRIGRVGVALTVMAAGGVVAMLGVR